MRFNYVLIKILKLWLKNFVNLNYLVHYPLSTFVNFYVKPIIHLNCFNEYIAWYLGRYGIESSLWSRVFTTNHQSNALLLWYFFIVSVLFGKRSKFILNSLYEPQECIWSSWNQTNLKTFLNFYPTSIGVHSVYPIP